MKPDLIVVGTSAGGVQALQKLVSGLPARLEAAVCVALHLPAEYESFLPQILSRAGSLPAEHPADGALLEMGRIYCAPADRHLLFEDGRLRVVRGPKENRHRPSIDVMFRSAAAVHGERVAGVLLTGSDDDGTAGLKMIQKSGGLAIVQDPHDSAFPDMPQSALQVLDPDYLLPLAEIGPLLGKVVSREITPERRHPMSEPIEKTFRQEEGVQIDPSVLGTPSAFSCPDCNGTLWEFVDGELVRYRCRVGHAYSAASMLEAQSDAVERALWTAVRVLEESASTARRIAQKSQVLHEDLNCKAAEREQHAKTLRELLLNSTA